MNTISKFLSNTYTLSILFIISFASGLVSLQTFSGDGIFKLNQFNVEALLFINLFLLIILTISILSKIYQTFIRKRNEELGGETSKNLVISFLLISSIPSVIITISSLFIFNYGIQNWFDNKILSLVNNSRSVAQNYLGDHQESIAKDTKLIANDLNRNKTILLANNDRFNQYIKFLSDLRGIDNLYLINSEGKLIKSSAQDKYKPPLKKLLLQASNGKPLIFSNAFEQKTLGILKLNNFENLYLYTVQNVDPKIVSFLKQTGEASTYYYSVKRNTLRIQITFFIVYIILTFALVLSSALFAINFAAKTTKPLNRLFTAAKSVSSGKYDFILGDDKNKDFKALNKVFDDMVAQMKIQKQKNILSGRFEAWQVIARKLAHEIKNPLTPIQLSLDRIKDKLENDENTLQHFTIINNQIHEISKLVNGFSDFARMPKPVFKKNNIMQIIDSSIDTYRLNYERVNFVLNNMTNTNDIICDSGQVNRALINIFKNAIESIEERFEKGGVNGEIIVNISNDNTYYLITIIDNGIGFKEAKNFKQDDPYFTTKKDGSGLGLSIVSKIIHEHNGQVFYDNREDNEGAFITITLPILNEENINN